MSHLRWAPFRPPLLAPEVLDGSLLAPRVLDGIAEVSAEAGVRAPKRSEGIKVTVTRAEKALIKQRATETAKSASAYLRELGIGKRPRSTHDIEFVRTLMQHRGDLGRVAGLAKYWLATPELVNGFDSGGLQGLVADAGRAQAALLDCARRVTRARHATFSGELPRRQAGERRTEWIRVVVSPAEKQLIFDAVQRTDAFYLGCASHYLRHIGLTYTPTRWHAEPFAESLARDLHSLAELGTLIDAFLKGDPVVQRTPPLQRRAALTNAVILATQHARSVGSDASAFLTHRSPDRVCA